MTLFQSWADSLTLLKPKNLQLFVMVTIKSIVEAYKLYFKYFWWLLFALPLFLFFAPDFATALQNNDSQNIAHYLTLLGMATLLYKLLLLAACFITRPSILQKDCAYFRTQFRKFIVWIFMNYFMALIMALLAIGISYGIAKIILPSTFVWFSIFIVSLLAIVKILLPFNFIWFSTTLPLPLSFLLFFQLPLNVLFVFFFADSEGGLKKFFVSLWNSLKMFVYNVPLLTFFIFCLSAPVVCFNHFFYVSPLMKIIIGAFCMPIGVCTYANIYIKRLHDQFDLYVKQPQ